jgi:E3 ubiquitin-protein ligase NRDP1
MGRDLEQFVHPERISQQLICPICTQVLKDPVQTSSDHLFCEDELLEWLTRSNLCPITKAVIDPSTIKKPSRIILNMLAELEVYCMHKDEGCSWTGTSEQLHSHLAKGCLHHETCKLKETMAKQEKKITDLSDRITLLEIRNEELVEENEELKTTVEDLKSRLRVFHALAPPGQVTSSKVSSFTEKLSDAERLKRLESLKISKEFKEGHK